MGKFYLRMDQEIQVCFTINRYPVGNGRGCIMGKEITFICSCLFHVGLCLIKESEEGFLSYFHISVFQYFVKR